MSTESADLAILDVTTDKFALLLESVSDVDWVRSTPAANGTWQLLSTTSSAVRESLCDALESPGSLVKVCDVPGGSVTGAGLMRVRIFDVTVHCWDLARSIGAPEVFLETSVSHAWKYARRHYGQPAPDSAWQQAEPADRNRAALTALLLLTGRKPHEWPSRGQM